MFPGIYFTGNIVVDTLVRPVAEMPEWGSTTCVESIQTHLGGNGSGTAVAAAMMGVPVRLAGAVGDDPAGNFALERMREAGVELSRVRRLPRTATAQTVGLVQPGGERLFFHQLGACGVFSAGDIPFDAGTIRGCRFFHYGSIFCLPALRPGARTVLEAARRAGLTTSLDMDWDPAGEWLRLIEPLLPLIDYLFLNLQEAEKLSGLRQPNRIGAFFRERGAGTVVLKLGEQGCEVFRGERQFHAPGYIVAAVDTTGAGDCFCGAFLAALCRGLPIEEAARLGNAVAAHTVQHSGNTNGIRDYEATLRWMETAAIRT